MKPFSETAEENKKHVFPVIQPFLQGVGSALEIASGTGQQIVYFAKKTPQVSWLATDLEQNIPVIRQWVEEAARPNLLQPQVLDVANSSWPVTEIEFAYTSNSLHIMSWQHVQALYARLGELMKEGSFLCVYGPFSFAGKHVSESNRRFDSYLKRRDPRSGVRDVDTLKTLAAGHTIALHECVDMPHKNHILVWQKQ